MWIQFLLLIGLVVFDAIRDNASDNNKKIAAHFFKFLFLVTVLLLVIYYPGTNWIDHIFILIGWYGVDRLFLFDLFWNTTENIIGKGKVVTLDFIGGTSWWDITISKILIKIKMPLLFWFWIRFCIWVAYSGAILTKYEL